MTLTPKRIATLRTIERVLVSGKLPTVKAIASEMRLPVATVFNRIYAMEYVDLVALTCGEITVRVTKAGKAALSHNGDGKP